VKPDVVVDVGNSRVKWGRCEEERVAEMASLPRDDEAAWESRKNDWKIVSGASWALSGVAPAQGARLQGWLNRQGFATKVLDNYRRLPLQVLVDEPDKVGLDRLLNAVAVNAVRPSDRGAIIVDAGTAVTVDYIDKGGRFRGGVIFPGYRLMAKALHEHTALLPQVEITDLVDAPATNTSAAIQSGIYHAVAGGIGLVASRLQGEPAAAVFVTGGDAALVPRLADGGRVWPEMTLEGIRLSAAAGGLADRRGRIR
jgi:type III pantothenate kinase